MRIGIVGGGVAGLSCALHLAPLVEKGLVASPIDVYEGDLPTNSAVGTGAVGRDIGVGVWSTALKPLCDSKEHRPSFEVAWNRLEQAGRWVDRVGYRTPGGAWLAKSRLPCSATNDMPGLLFLREKDLLMALREAVHLEERAGTVKIHWDKSSNSTQAQGIYYKNAQEYSAPLTLNNDSPSLRDYHLIVAADGMSSTLRQHYGGYREQRQMIGTAALRRDPSQYVANSQTGASGQAQDANAIEDRNYTVFRGNADLTMEETGEDGVSFQTWGVGKSMRFATVPMSYGSDDLIEKQVWFITTSDESITHEPDPIKRHEMLLDAFSDWHEPIPKLLKATAPQEILMERAMAHKYSMGPVLEVNQILSRLHGKHISGPGPALLFVGDSYMTVDPILAQGFTMAMEGAHELAASVERSQPDSSTFDPYELRRALQTRHDVRGQRLLCLLRATEIVQALGQPDSKTLGGLVSQSLVRPLMRLSPDFVKRPIFDSMLKYSLGVQSSK